MTISNIGKRSDGKYLGEDEDGNLFVGTKKRVGFSALTRIVKDGQAVYKYGDYIHAKGPATVKVQDPDNPEASIEEPEPDNAAPCESIFNEMLVRTLDPDAPDGYTETMASVERKVEVIDWVAL